MSDQKYIVLELVSPAPEARRTTFSALAQAKEPPEVRLDVQALSPKDVADARQAPGIMVAKPAPIKLIEPLAADGAAAPAAGTPAWGVTAVNAVNSAFTGKGVKVAVLDTGIDKSHAAFAGLKITEKDFTGEGNGDVDSHGHGTHCAGTIAGRDVNGTRIGIAQGIDELLAVKVLGTNGGETTAITSAMLWAVENGANVLSMSLGMDFPGLVARMTANGMPIQPATSQALQIYRDNVKIFTATANFIEVSSGFNRQAVVVAATGNESERATYTIDVAPPAASDGFVKVAALGQNGSGVLSVASFSNTGPTLAGPGVDIVSAKAGGGLRTLSGTSMATPHVAGVAALWAEQLAGGLTPQTLRAELTATALAVNGLSVIDGGSGLVQAP